MDWSAKQSRILTAGGLASSRYHTPGRGHPTVETDLPHHHLRRGATQCHETFLRWRRDGDAEARRKRGGSVDGDGLGRGDDYERRCRSLITGAWRRTVFHGGFEHTTDADETVYNVQTPSLFVDLRIPTTRPRFEHCGSIGDLSDEELRMYARQHVFAGYTLLSTEERCNVLIGGKVVERTRPVATRHHCVDWNFVGWNPRGIPNRWYVEVEVEPTDVEGGSGGGGEGATGSFANGSVCQKWKEWAYATDDHGQHYYVEQWERLRGDECGRGRVLALKRRPPAPSEDAADRGHTRQSEGCGSDDDRDGVLVVVGDHFSYVRGRSQSLLDSLDLSPYRSCKSLVDLVDAAVARGDRATAEAFMSIEAGHGRIEGDGGGDGGVGEDGGGTGGRWRIDSAIPPWREGSSLFFGDDSVGDEGVGASRDDIRVVGRSTRDCQTVWNSAPWDVFECSGIETVGELRELFGTTAGSLEMGGGGTGVVDRSRL